MKKVKFISFILKVTTYILGCSGGLLCISAIGGLEQVRITFGRFFLYEFLAIGLILLAFIVYNFRSMFNYKYFKK